MKNVADIYPLSPVQLGMLFHTLATEQPGVYINQYTCQLQGTLEPLHLQQAWQQTVERHAVLRTAFLWEGLEEPLQVVRETVELPWCQLDWRDVSESVQAEQLGTFLQSDRTQGFDLAQAPLLRLTLIQLNDLRYQLVWSSHHLLFDGWSLPLIWQDMLAYYAASRQGRPCLLEPAQPYRNYIAWRQAQDTAIDERFWRSQLNHFTQATPLPAAYTASHTETKTNPYSQQTQVLDVTFTENLKAFARQRRLTLNTLVQAAWTLLLSHYNDSEQVIYGSVVSGRPATLSGVEKMVGLFINTLPVCVELNTEQPLTDWLQNFQQQLLALREYETTPLTNIQHWSQLPTGSSLFESIVVFENYPTAAAPHLGFEVHNVRYLEQSNYPLALLVVPTDSLELLLLYDTGRFEEGAIAQLLNYIQQLLTAFVEHPKAKLIDLPARLSAHQHPTIRRAQVEYPRDRCIHQLIETQATQTPDAQAVVFNNESITYAELNKRANQLAHELRARGITQGTRVALCLNRSLEMMVGILAILKAGGAYVPLDPAYPSERLTYCLQDTSPKLLLTEQSIQLSDSHIPRLNIEGSHTEEGPFTAQSTENLDNLATPDDTAYIIYTSGSTGGPKGVMVSQQNLVHSTTARSRVYAEPVDRFLLLSSIAFDSSVAGIFWTLCQGGTLVISPPRIEQDLHQLAHLIAQQQITHTLCIPTLYSLLLSSSDKRQPLNSLRTVIVAGESCSRSLAQQHYAHLPHAKLYNEYGPTEATVWCSDYRIPAVLPPGPIAIGTAISNTHICLLNKQQQPVPIGAVGEIYVGGDGVSQGYLNQPEKTAAAFCVLAAVENASRFYRTGDLGRYRADSTLEWLGRCDRQVKIRGYRIELGEIEEVLRSQPTIQETVVVAKDSSQPNSSIESLVTALAALETERAEALLSAVEEV